MSTTTKYALIIALVTSGFVGKALAGKVIYAEGEDLPSAIAAATKAVEAAARKTCVSTYPSADTCEQLADGRWRCYGVKANNKGSCK